MEEKKKGGTRPGAGRKPLDDPKEQIALYVHQTAVAKFGGKDGLKNALYGFIYGSAPKIEKKTFPKSDAEIKAASHEKVAKEESKGTVVFEGEIKKPEHSDTILKQIEAIRAEKCPEHRNTPLGKKAWQMEQNKRIEALQNQLNGNK